MAYVDNVAIGTKRRRNVKKVYQDTSNAYRSDNTGKSYSTGDYTLSKSKGIDKLQGTKEEKRGRSNKGNAKHTYKTTGTKSRNKSRQNKSKAKRGGK